MVFRFFIFLIFISCGTNKMETNVISDPEISSFCPEDGTCTFEILNNKKLDITYYNINKPSPQVISGSNIVIQFEYKRHEIPNSVDGNYSEFLYLELPKNKLEQQLKDVKLQEVKLLYGRICYCKGQTGYYKITQGMLSIKKHNSDNIYDFSLKFKTDEVPQIITEVKETFRL
tara:strand:- start:48 stop:566 length:519 start_codon:yes stop_codon:yes gene_type:complete